MYSWYVRVNAKMPAVMMPGTITGTMIIRNAWNRVQPSICALSSISRGTVRTKPMRSQVQNGRVNDGYTSTRAHTESVKPRPRTTCDSGMKSSVDGIRYERNIAVDRGWAPGNRMRASA